MGTGVGFGAALWGRRKVRTTLERYRPAQMGAEATQTVRRLSDDLRSAREEGRQAMHQREAELRLRHPRPPEAPDYPLTGPTGSASEGGRLAP
ncbi:MAG: hypothetical protein M3535_08540 [Actinomycetota bacterium]|nr:hypothetical protein [Actinomycetota bacterium]